MSNDRILVTGATGMTGSLFTRGAVERGANVRALVRPADRQGSGQSPQAAADRQWLRDLGVEVVEADLAQPESLAPALAGVDMVVHTAAHIGEWGPVEKYRKVNVYGLEHLLSAAEAAGGLKRLVQISTLAVYPARHHYGTDETLPADLHGFDGYTRTKAEADLILQHHMDTRGLPGVILRPGSMYGPGDRHYVPRLIERITSGKMKLIGDGRKVLNNTYVGHLVDAIFLALEKDEAVGETFNIRDERLVTREEFIGTICDYLGRPRPGRVPLWLARSAVGPIEWIARARGNTEAPLLTRSRIKFMTLNLDFSVAKAKEVLGYQPRVDFREGIREALDWITGAAASRQPASESEAAGQKTSSGR